MEAIKDYFKYIYLMDVSEEEPLESERPTFSFSVYDVSLVDLSVYPAIEKLIGLAGDLKDVDAGMIVSLVVSRLQSIKLDGTRLICERFGGRELHEFGSKSSSADSCAASILLIA